MLERDLKRYSAYFRGWCQAFGEHESLHRDTTGVNWLFAEDQVGLVLPKTMIRPLYREVLLQEQVPTLKFEKKRVRIGAVDIPLEKKHRKETLAAIEKLFGSCDEVHLFLTSHLLYSGSKIITFSRKRPLAIIYKEIGTLHARLD